MAPNGGKKSQNENSKGGITGTIVVTATGVTLPFQLIYSGKTERSLPKGFQQDSIYYKMRAIGPMRKQVLI